MNFVTAICVAVCFAVSVYLLLGRDLKGIAMGVFLIGHAANLSILAMSGSPVLHEEGGALFKAAPMASYETPREDALATMVDPLPQALILTAIVIGFAVMGFLLTLLVVTARSTQTLELHELAEEDAPAPAADIISPPGGSTAVADPENGGPA
jgi:multicomponent Na+:H+ antiporter subunit C